MIVLKATQDKLLAALQSVAGIVERRHTLPIMANVLLRKHSEQLQLTTSDLEIQIRTQAELGGDASSYATTQRLALGAAWKIGAKTTLRGQFDRGRRDFRGALADVPIARAAAPCAQPVAEPDAVGEPAQDDLRHG